MLFAFLITDGTFELSDFKLMSKDLFLFDDYSETEIEYQSGDNERTYFYIARDNMIFDLMDVVEQNLIRLSYETFNIFSCRFFDFTLLKKIVSIVPTEIKLMIDNDYGSILSRDEFLRVHGYNQFLKS